MGEKDSEREIFKFWQEQSFFTEPSPSQTTAEQLSRETFLLRVSADRRRLLRHVLPSDCRLLPSSRGLNYLTFLKFFRVFLGLLLPVVEFLNVLSLIQLISVCLHVGIETIERVLRTHLANGW